jgi:transcriptional regulator with XRE-family HTH domain
MAQLTPAACRAARALLDWTIHDLARHAGIGSATVSIYERGERPAFASTEKKILAAFTAHGVEITNGDGTGARLLNARRKRSKTAKRSD